MNKMKRTILVNLFGGPGISKSTTSCGIFSLLKIHDVDCEYVPEFAKDLVWEERHKSLQNQLYIFSKQYHRLWRLNGIVDVIITDSPLLFSLVYNNDNESSNFRFLVKEYFNSFNNLNFLLKRKKKYNPNGRYKTEEEAKLIDDKILNMLKSNNIKFKEIPGNYMAIDKITKQILSYFGKKLKYSVKKI